MKEWNINDMKNPKWMIYSEDWYYPGAVFFDNEEEAREHWKNEEQRTYWNGSCLAKIEAIIVPTEGRENE